MVNTVSAVAFQRQHQPIRPGFRMGQAVSEMPPTHKPAAMPVSPGLMQAYFGAVPKVRFSGIYTPKHYKYGADFKDGVTHYKVWAPAAKKVELVTLRPKNGPDDKTPLLERIESSAEMKKNEGSFHADAPHIPGTLYMYRLVYEDGKAEIKPDPRANFQPEGVHGPSQVVDLKAFKPEAPKDWWKDNAGMHDDRRQIVYRLHVGTFTDEGTFEAAVKKLDHIEEMGYNFVEIMPVMEFPGERGWSYDQVKHFSPHRNYGEWQNFQRLVDECHKRGLGVSLDVCYNHMNTEGNYFGWFDPEMANRSTDWGPGFNWKNPQAKRFVLDNVGQWVETGGVDMFRFDMTPHFHDDQMLSDVNIKLAELSERLERPVTSVAEDYREWDELVKNIGFDKVYFFNGHHALEAALTGKEYMGNSPHLRHLFWIYALKNYSYSMADHYNFGISHDEVANGSGGKRPITKYEAMGLSHPKERAMLKSLIKYFLPGTPRNFMGEEYGEKADFRFIADYQGEKIKEDTRKNRRDPYDPFDPEAVKASKLTWEQDTRLKELTRKAIELRNTMPSLWQGDQRNFYAYDRDIDSGVFTFRRWSDQPGDETLVVINFSDNAYGAGDGKVQFPTGGPKHEDVNVEWVEVYNTDTGSLPGGGGMTNKGHRFQPGESGANLAPCSIAVFKRKDKS